MSTKQPLAGKIALVTGASRGIGRGIAVQLGEAGATVYITGRTLTATNGLGSLQETADEITKRGGICIPLVVDHENDTQLKELFEKIDKEQDGRLDILVNNAYKAVDSITEIRDMKFYDTKPELWDDVINVGLRSHYFCTVYASRMMVKLKKGLIVNISSWGGFNYVFNCAYGVGKCALDRMAADCSIELKDAGVTMVSFYPGAVKTEKVVHYKDKLVDTKESLKKTNGLKFNNVFATAESTEFSGKCIVALALDPKVMNYTGKVVIGAEYAQQFGIKDIDGRTIYSLRQMKFMAETFFPNYLKFLAYFIPQFIKAPAWMLNYIANKF